MKLQTLSLIILTSFGIAAATTSNAWAQETTFTGPNGNKLVRQQNITPDNGTVNVNRTTSFNGRTTSATGSFTGTGNGSYSGEANRTNAQGNTNSYRINGQINRSDGTFQNNATITGSNGNQSTFNNTRSCNNGQCNSKRVLTYPNGQTRTYNGSATRTDSGTWTGAGSVTSRNGKERTFGIYRQR
jgi:hypothetical protein